MLAQPADSRLQQLVPELCALAYGSDEQPAKDVLEYCRRKVDFDEGTPSESEVRRLGRLRKFGDDGPRGSTGFHTYSSSGNWEWDEAG
jgi:hypothetical protein